MARKKGLAADYQGAPPEQVAAAMLKHSPGANQSGVSKTSPSPQDSDDQAYCESLRAVLADAEEIGRQALRSVDSDTSEEEIYQDSLRR